MEWRRQRPRSLTSLGMTSADDKNNVRTAALHARLTVTQPTYNSTRTLATTAAGVPTLAIVGRPNVGKSTLFNRIVGSRRAIVGDEPGITRDRLYGDAEWRGRHIRIIDTGGIIPEDKDFIPSEIFRQARVAFDEAAAIVMVVDGRSNVAAPDLELVRLLRKTNRPRVVDDGRVGRRAELVRQSFRQSWNRH